MKKILILFFLLISIFVTAQNGKYIGKIVTFSIPTGMSLNYAIMSGNYSTAFKVDFKKGELFINNQTAIDAYAGWYYTLVVRLRYSKNNVIVTDSMRTIRILNTINNKFIGKFIARDPDNEITVTQILNFYFVSGNYSTAFKINGKTGDISIANVSVINNWMKTNDKYTINTRVRDNGVPYKESFANAIILLFDNLPKQDVFNCRYP